MNTNKTLEKCTFAGGCFWCMEAIFKRLKGVKLVTSGYSGGTIENPDYKTVSSGNTGYAECIQIEFDPTEISFEVLLDIFWHLHNPTTINQQGADIGTQYRSVIFYHTEEQKRIAIESKNNLEKSAYYKNPIITQIIPFMKFYKAEEYHQDFYDKNKNYSYCSIVIDPKIKKLISEYKDILKDDKN